MVEYRTNQSQFAYDNESKIRSKYQNSGDNIKLFTIESLFEYTDSTKCWYEIKSFPHYEYYLIQKKRMDTIKHYNKKTMKVM